MCFFENSEKGQPKNFSWFIKVIRFIWRSLLRLFIFCFIFLLRWRITTGGLREIHHVLSMLLADLKFTPNPIDLLPGTATMTFNSFATMLFPGVVLRIYLSFLYESIFFNFFILCEFFFKEMSSCYFNMLMGDRTQYGTSLVLFKFEVDANKLSRKTNKQFIVWILTKE